MITKEHLRRELQVADEALNKRDSLDNFQFLMRIIKEMEDVRRYQEVKGIIEEQRF